MDILPDSDELIELLPSILFQSGGDELNPTLAESIKTVRLVPSSDNDNFEGQKKEHSRALNHLVSQCREQVCHLCHEYIALYTHLRHL